MIHFGLVGFASNADAGHAGRFVHRTFKSFVIRTNLTNDGLVHFVDRASSRASINACAIPNDGIFLAMTFLGRNRNHQVLAHGPFMNLPGL